MVQGRKMNWEDIEKAAMEILNLRPDGWTKPHLHDLAKLFEEGGEVAECMVKSKKTKEDLGDELSDVLTVIAVIAIRNNIDMRDAHRRKQAERVQKLVNRFHNGVYPEPKINVGGNND
jgi:NTP pyrophosphatase (non-canonical NTP hydrolase)